jgi:hypothetical protein
MSHDYDTGEYFVRQFETQKVTVEFASCHTEEGFELSIQDNDEESSFGESYINLRNLVKSDIESLHNILGDILSGLNR